jgi:hypothetical protein
VGTKTGLTLGAFAILALLIAGVSYWAIRGNAQSGPPARNLAESPSSVQTPSAPKNAPPIEQEKQTADASPQTSPPSTAPAAPSPRPSAPPTTAGQSKEVPTPPSSSSTSAAPGPSRQVSSEKPPSAAMELAMPDEDKMSEANRRQVQTALHGLGYYNGPVDGIFGPLTRASIRRFQDSIGEEATGRLTAAEAGRLENVTGLETGAGAQGTGGPGIPEAPVGHRHPTQADLPPSVRQEEQGNVPAPDNPPAARNNARARGGSNRDSGSTGNTGAYGQIPSICTGC